MRYHRSAEAGIILRDEAVRARAASSADTLPDPLPLRPLARGGRGAPGAVQPQRHLLGEPVTEEGLQLMCGEEADVQPGLRPAAVADGVTVAGRGLDHVVVVFDVGGRGVHPDAEQPARRDPGGGFAEVAMGLSASAVLEDLDPDDQVVIPRHRGEIPDDQPVGAVGTACPQLGDRFGGDVDADQVQARVEQGQQVTAVAATDVDASAQPVPGSRRHDVVDEADGRVVEVSTGKVLDIPQLGSVHPRRVGEPSSLTAPALRRRAGRRPGRKCLR
ncbi:hypothetical protein GCM10009662_80510 [Catellatospora coxensis]|uniref:Uncharacterized protein n=1 Tax=Catellatospora coxensis TaxID=310354 RepID=A0A8J3L186_9ACTN|nr:hypothetical protein Cco03nite_73250 [Catellatospora coxensis]